MLVDRFKLLGDEDRLRLLALCAEEELTVGELATLLDESQPQVTKKSQPLRDAGLLRARRDGTRTLLATVMPDPRDVSNVAADLLLATALDEGRAMCAREGTLARIPKLVRQREEHARKFFDTVAPAGGAGAASAGANAVGTGAGDEAAGPHVWLPLLAPLLPSRSLAVDVGTGDGALLPLLSPLYDRVVAVDRSAARLARCAEMIAARGLANVRLREADADDTALVEGVHKKGGADVVTMARVLHHAARPHDAVAAAVHLLKRGGHLIVLDYLPHDDESMRDQGDVWLGFDPLRLRELMTKAGLDVVAIHPFPTTTTAHEQHPLQIAVGKKEHTDHGHSH